MPGLAWSGSSDRQNALRANKLLHSAFAVYGCMCYTKGNTAQFPPCGLSTAPAAAARHLRCQMLDNVGLRYPHRASGTKAPRTLRPLPLLRFAVSATGGAHLCSIQYYLCFWLGICRTSLAVSALRIMRYCLKTIDGAAEKSKISSISTNAAGFCVKKPWNPQRIPAALCLKSVLRL